MQTNWENRFSKIAQRTQPPQISWLMAQALEVPDMISLAAGFVDQSSLPHDPVRTEMDEFLRKSSEYQSPLQYGTTAGDIGLRSCLIEKMRDEQCIPAHIEVDETNVIIGSGSQQVLYLALETMIDEDDIVLMEAPTYFVVLGAVKSRGANTIGLDTDEHGLIPECLAETLAFLEKSNQLEKVKMLYLMTYATNPQGVQLSIERRQQIMDILLQYREKGYPILLLEDAAYRHISFEHNELLPMYSLQQYEDMVLYTESFSKSLAPGLRVGYGLGPKSIIQKMTDIKGNHDFGSSNLSIRIVKSMIESGEFLRHTEKLRKTYQSKWQLVNRILKESLPANVSWITPTGGFYTWVELPQEISTNIDSPLFQEALKEKVLYVPGNLCYSPDREESHISSSIRLSFGMIDEDKLNEGCLRFARAIHSIAPLCDAVK